MIIDTQNPLPLPSLCCVCVCCQNHTHRSIRENTEYHQMEQFLKNYKNRRKWYVVAKLSLSLSYKKNLKKKSQNHKQSKSQRIPLNHSDFCHDISYNFFGTRLAVRRRRRF